ncbi:MAG: ribonuclease H-like domain-containing protein [Bacteroidota bacterium]
MSTVVFDIETLAYPFESMEQKQQDYLLKFCKTEEEKIIKIQEMALSPFTARVIAIGMLNAETHNGMVLYFADNESSHKSDDGKIEFIAFTDERKLLEEFWSIILRYPQFVTFNGRSFDCPFLLLRSAMLKVKPTRNLMPYRYDTKQHCDILEQFTFYGATRRFSLDFICKSFGIQSPKEQGITGLDLQPLFAQKRFFEIAEYCIGDVIATAELYRIWQQYMSGE